MIKDILIALLAVALSLQHRLYYEQRLNTIQGWCEMAVLANTNKECVCANGGIAKFSNQENHLEYGQIESFWPTPEDNKTISVYVNDGELIDMYQHIHIHYWKPNTNTIQLSTLHGTSAFCIQSCYPSYIKNPLFINPLA